MAPKRRQVAGRKRKRANEDDAKVASVEQLTEEVPAAAAVTIPAAASAAAAAPQDAKSVAAQWLFWRNSRIFNAPRTTVEQLLVDIDDPNPLRENRHTCDLILNFSIADKWIEFPSDPEVCRHIAQYYTRRTIDATDVYLIVKAAREAPVLCEALLDHWPGLDLNSIGAEYHSGCTVLHGAIVGAVLDGDAAGRRCRMSLITRLLETMSYESLSSRCAGVALGPVRIEGDALQAALHVADYIRRRDAIQIIRMEEVIDLLIFYADRCGFPFGWRVRASRSIRCDDVAEDDRWDALLRIATGKSLYRTGLVSTLVAAIRPATRDRIDDLCGMIATYLLAPLL